MGHLNETLITLAGEAGTGRAKGDRFEHLIQTVFTEHPGQWGKERFVNVWSWREWPGREDAGFGGQDIGVDLVAEQTEAYGGGLCAVQCKFYQPDATIPTATIDSFLAAAPTKVFTERLLIATANVASIGVRKLDLNGAKVLYTAEMDGWVDDWRTFLTDRLIKFDPPRKHTELWDHQQQALTAVLEGFQRSDRGKLILPCGAGKSLTALRIAEQQSGPGGTVIYLVPSLALVGQTMNEWSVQKTLPLQYLAVCSDPGVGRQLAGTRLNELCWPVTTDPDVLSDRLDLPAPAGHMRVVFATYQSAQVVSEAGHRFDLMICDEAHRTTGIEETVRPGEGSPFRLIHDDENIPAVKRLYMTATPRVFTAAQRRRAVDPFFDGQAYSMDDEVVFGPEFYRMSFADAVETGVLADYRIAVIAVDEEHLWQAEGTNIFYKWGNGGYTPQGRSVDGKRQPTLTMEDAVRLTGIWDALATPTSDKLPGEDHRSGEIPETGGLDDRPARSALLFANKVARSKEIAMIWAGLTNERSEDDGSFLPLRVNHIDGKTPAADRLKLLGQLRKADHGNFKGTDRPVCEVLTNVKVLTEGVDVPGLDAVVFLDPKTSAVDITQAVGRAMRKTGGKETGTVVIPVILNLLDDLATDMARTEFETVGKVVRALRSHDERVDYWLSDPDVWADRAPMTVRVISGVSAERRRAVAERGHQIVMSLTRRVGSVVVDMAGDRHMWPTWGKRAAAACDRVLTRMRNAVNGSTKVQAAADRFSGRIAATLSGGRSLPGGRGQALEMAAHHVVTMPVFDSLFDKQFSKRNPVSRSVERFLSDLAGLDVSFEDELRPMHRAYRRLAEVLGAASISATRRLDVIRQIYDGFFAEAAPGLVKRLGIVYTPIEIVEFMARSADAIIREEFGKQEGLASSGVQILDPFSGTGTFTAYLLEGSQRDRTTPLIPDSGLRDVWERLHASELTLLSYYVGAVNVEGAYHRRLQDAGLLGCGEYAPWTRTVLRDTFVPASDDGDLFNEDSNELRAAEQDGLPIDVILANPPWSSGQDSAGDDNPNLSYPAMAARVRELYGVRHRQVTGKPAGGSAMGNLYVKALRRCSDLVRERGGDRPVVIGLVHPNSLADGTSLTGVRACLRDEFTAIYVVNLLGNAYKSGEEYRREGEKLFGGGSRNGVQITFLVYNPAQDTGEPAILRYAEVPPYSTLEEKWDWLDRVGNVLSPILETVPVVDGHEWVNLPDPSYERLTPLYPTGRPANRGEHLITADTTVIVHASGVKTNCDTYVYSFDRSTLEDKIQRLIDAYEDARYLTDGDSDLLEEATRNTQLNKIKWTGTLKQSLKQNIKLEYDPTHIREVLYRPFIKLWLYEDERILASVKTISAMFPRDDEGIYDEQRGGGGSKEYGSSELSPPPYTETSRPQERHKPAGPSSEGDPGQQREQHDLPGAGRGEPHGPGGDQGLSADAGDTASQITGGGGGQQAILITTPSNKAVFGALASSVIGDLCAVGTIQASRAIPRRRS